MAEPKPIDVKEVVDKGHIQYKCKCLHCGLHFTVHSWFKDWGTVVKEPYCPECGQKSRILATRESIKNIYEEVPGGDPQPTGACPLCMVKDCDARVGWDLMESEDFECPRLSKSSERR